MNRTLTLSKNKLSGWSYLFIYIVIFIALIVLAGWQFNIELLERPIPNLVAMNPLTALSFILFGISFLLLLKNRTGLSNYAGYILAAITIFISLLKLTGTLTPTFSRIDLILFSSKVRTNSPANMANRMALTTAMSFVLSGFSLLFINYETAKKRVPAQYISLIILSFGFFSLLGYLYGAPEFYDLLRHFPMAVHTAICFILISLALLFVHPYRGVIKELAGDLTGSITGRLLLPAAIIIPVLLGEIRIYFLDINGFSTGLGITFLVLSLIIIFCLLIFYNVVLLNRKDALRKTAEEKLSQSEEIFRSLTNSIREYAIFMLDANGNVITWNEGAEAIKGYTEDEIKGKHMSVFYTKEDREKNLPGLILETARKNGKAENQGWRLKKDGSVFWADAVIIALYNNLGKLSGYSKVTKDATEDKKAKDLLLQFNKELQKQVDEKTNKLEEITSQLRQLSAYLQTAREEERRNIAREIHDELGQMLVGLKMDVVWLRKKIAAKDEIITARFSRTLELLNETRQAMHRISTNLHPAVLEDLGLVSALTIHGKEFESRSGIITNFTSDLKNLNDMNISPDIAIGLYRIFQESLTNVAKHANAKEINSYLKAEDNVLTMFIHDDGTGFDIKETAEKKTLGLVSMRERALMLNGLYQINSLPGKGTTIQIKVPVKTD